MVVNSIAYNMPLLGGIKVRTAPLLKDCKLNLAELKMFYHHIYEYKKGIRNLVLATEKSEFEGVIRKRLENEGVAFLIQEVNPRKINVFFGDEECIQVVKTFKGKLNELSAEEDFILGTMLGYSRLEQCRRFLKIKNNIILFKKEN